MSSERELLIQEISQVRFTPVRLREGYDMGEVDAFLERLVVAVRAGEPIGELVRTVRFTPVRVAAGYLLAEVDDFLDRVVAEAAALDGTPSAYLDGPEAPVASAPHPRAQSLIEEINRARFTPVRIREGYEMGGVDDLLDRVVTALQSGDPIDGLVRGARFTPVRMREAYDMGEVDRFLERVVALAATAERTPPAYVDASPSVIEEQRGLLSRLFRR